MCIKTQSTSDLSLCHLGEGVVPIWFVGNGAKAQTASTMSFDLILSLLIFGGKWNKDQGTGNAHSTRGRRTAAVESCGAGLSREQDDQSLDIKFFCLL